MPSQTRSTEKPLEGLSDRALKGQIARAKKEIKEIDRLDPAELARQRKTDEAIARMESATTMIEVANAELARRKHQSAIDAIPLSRQIREAWRGPHPATATLRNVARFAHPELQGEKLAPSRLSAEETEELDVLVKRRLAVANGQDGAEPLTEAEQARYEEILGVAAGDESLFERKRTEAVAREKIGEIGKARKRHPEAGSLVAAVIGDPTVFDFLHAKIRHDVRVLDEYGHATTGATTGRILEPEHVSTLFLVLSRIGENGGRAITVTQHGALGEGLPFIPAKTLQALRRNGWLTVRTEGSGFHVGVGPRVRSLAKKWEITLPPEEASA